MVAFRVGEDMHKVFEVGKQAEALINAKLKAPMELELENVYFPFMLFSKKVRPHKVHYSEIFPIMRTKSA